MDLAALIADPARVTDCDADAIPDMLLELASLQSALTAQLVATRKNEDGSDELLDVGQAAKRLCLAVDTVYRNHRKFPFTVHVGRALRFSRIGLDRYLARQRSREQRRVVSGR